ncbi:hypothetical protein EG329_001872 [Mollisiaceae sp. DMI_Dod_QoI]|nr:hypothetical protein EG329_001872 [Helotiales sp. DMI_Dod_QoI]
MEDLLAILGYHKQHPTRNGPGLHSDITEFYAKWVAAGNHIPSTRKISEAAVHCAREFLLDGNRAERLFPPNLDGAVEWPADRDYIEEAVGHLFRRKAISSKIVAVQTETKRKKAAGIPTQQACKSQRKRKRKHSPREEKVSCEAILQPTAMKEWNEPPSDPSAKTCSDYIRSLNPDNDEKLTGFTKNWLAEEGAAWPGCDHRLQRFMHDNDFYLLVNHGKDETPESIKFATSLRQGTQIQDIEPKESAIFLRKVFAQINQVTQQLTTHPTFVLKCRRDATVHKTNRFHDQWERKETYWTAAQLPQFGDSEQKSAKRRKSKTVERQQSYASSYVQSPVERSKQTPQADLLMSTAADALGLSGSLAYLPGLEMSLGIDQHMEISPTDQFMSGIAEGVMLSDQPIISAGSLSSNVSFGVDATPTWANEYTPATSLDLSSPRGPSSRRQGSINGEGREKDNSVSSNKSNTIKESRIVKLPVFVKLESPRTKPLAKISSPQRFGCNKDMPVDLTADDTEWDYVPGELDMTDESDDNGLTRVSAHVKSGWNEDRHCLYPRTAIHRNGRVGSVPPKKGLQKRSNNVAFAAPTPPALTMTQQVHSACPPHSDIASKTELGLTNHQIIATKSSQPVYSSTQPPSEVVASLNESPVQQAKISVKKKNPQSTQTALLSDHVGRPEEQVMGLFSQTSYSPTSPANPNLYGTSQITNELQKRWADMRDEAIMKMQAQHNEARLEARVTEENGGHLSDILGQTVKQTYTASNDQANGGETITKPTYPSNLSEVKKIATLSPKPTSLRNPSLSSPKSIKSSIIELPPGSTSSIGSPTVVTSPVSNPHSSTPDHPSPNEPAGPKSLSNSNHDHQPPSTQSINSYTLDSTATQVVPNPEAPKFNSSYAIVPPSTPFSTKPSPSEESALPQANNPPSEQSALAKTKPNLERSLFKPITDRDPNIKTFEIVIALEDGTIDVDNAFSFQHAQDATLAEFFDFYSIVSGVPNFKLKALTFTPAFGTGYRVVKMERVGDAARNEQSWKLKKRMIMAFFQKAEKEEVNERKFQVLVEVA